MIIPGQDQPRGASRDARLEMKLIEKMFPNEIEEALVQTDNELVLDDDEESDEKILKWMIRYNFLVIR